VVCAALGGCTAWPQNLSDLLPVEGPPDSKAGKPAVAAPPADPPALPAAPGPLPRRITPVSQHLVTADVPAATLTISDIVQTTLENHPALRVRQHEIQVAQAKVVTAGMWSNPQFVMDTEAQLQEPRNTDLTARLMFTVPVAGKRGLRIAAASAGVAAAQWAWKVESKSLMLEAVAAAVDVRYLQELQTLQRQAVTLSTQLAELQRERFQVAAVQYRNVILAELAASDQDLALRNTSARLEQAQRRLTRAMGLVNASPPTVVGQLSVELVPDVASETVQQRACQVAPALAQSQMLLNEDLQRHALERKNAIPDLSIGPRVQTAIGTDIDDRAGGRVSIDLPIFNHNQGPIAETAAEACAEQARARLLETQAVNDSVETYRDLADVQARWQHFVTAVRPMMQRTEAAIREAFDDRAATAYDLADLQQTLLRMQVQDLDLRYQHQRLRTRLEVLLECRLGDLAGGQAPAELFPSAPPAAPAPPKP